MIQNEVKMNINLLSVFIVKLGSKKWLKNENFDKNDEKLKIWAKIDSKWGQKWI